MRKAAIVIGALIALILGSVPLALPAGAGNGPVLTVEPLFREPMHLVAALDHDLAATADTAERALAGNPLLTLDPRHHLARQAADIAARYGMTIAPDYYGTSLESLHQMVASGLGLALLPGLYLHDDTGGATGLKILSVRGWRVHRSIAIAWRRQSPMDAAFRLIADHVQACARRLLAE